jgi:hypothetical protein
MYSADEYEYDDDHEADNSRDYVEDGTEDGSGEQYGEELDDDVGEDDDGFENYITRTYVCEDCDFRWAEKIYPERNDYPDYDDELGRAHICPMCGSLNVSFI